MSFCMRDGMVAWELVSLGTRDDGPFFCAVCRALVRHFVDLLSHLATGQTSAPTEDNW